MDELERLKTENERLRLLAWRDSLTGLWNRGTMEKLVAEALRGKAEGAFLMLDVDEFKYINDQYGHLTGDRVLQELAHILQAFFFKQDLVGRMGGDEFAVFLSGNYQEKMVKEKMEHLNARIGQAVEGLQISSGVRITVGAAYAAEADTFQALYGRADAAMRSGKRNWRRVVHFYEPDLKKPAVSAPERRRSASLSVDITCISRMLRETDVADGAYCRDFSTFLSIYRFLERGLERSGRQAYMILASLTDRHGDFVGLEDRPRLMEYLEESIRAALRSSDVYTRYSSCQFLAMAPGAACENMELITSRIQNAFHMRVSGQSDVQLTFSFYPLQPLPGKGRNATPKEARL